MDFSFFQNLLPGARERKDMNLAALEAARRARLAVRQQVMEMASEMSPAEARGYIRARSGLIIRREVDRVIYLAPQTLIQRRELIIEQAVQMAVAQAIVDVKEAASTARPLRRVA